MENKDGANKRLGPFGRNYTLKEKMFFSSFLPGFGQFANYQKNKGLLVAIPSGILFVHITVQVFILALYTLAPAMGGDPLTVDQKILDMASQVMVAVSLAFLVWCYGMVDTYVTGSAMDDEDQQETSSEDNSRQT